MTKKEFQELTEKVLILDGATGSNLMAQGMPRGICTEQWVIEHKRCLQNLQSAYIEAGSQVIYAPTFGGNRRNLQQHGLEERIEESIIRWFPIPRCGRRKSLCGRRYYYIRAICYSRGRVYL